MNRRGFFSILCGMFAAAGIGQKAEAGWRIVPFSPMGTATVAKIDGQWVVLSFNPPKQRTTVRRGLFGGTVVRTRIR